jgi:dolichol-phosphate mannosyltransferase
MDKVLCTVVVPVYMNEGSLLETHRQIREIFRSKTLFKKYQYELIFINDGSKDDSFSRLLEIKKRDRQVKVLDLSRNFGQVAAIYAGLAKASGEVLINISADLQDPVELIEKMLLKWEKGFKVVACSRIEREDGWKERLVSGIFYRIINYFFPGIPKGGFDYFLLDRIVYKKMLRLNDRNTFIQADILWFGYQPYFIEYKRRKRMGGKSQWTISKKIKYCIDGIFSVTYLPIRLMSLCGLIVASLGFAYSGLVVFLWLFRETPFSGYAPLLMSVLVCSGLLMIMLGIIGEYLWRVHDQVRRRPRYIIKNVY